MTTLMKSVYCFKSIFVLFLAGVWFLYYNSISAFEKFSSYLIISSLRYFFLGNEIHNKITFTI